MYYAFRGNGKEDFDREALKFLVDHFTKVRMKYVEYDVGMKYPDSRIIFSQIPGGMYSNLLKQLKEQRMEHLLDKVLEEVPRVQKTSVIHHSSHQQVRSWVFRRFSTWSMVDTSG